LRQLIARAAMISVSFALRQTMNTGLVHHVPDYSPAFAGSHYWRTALPNKSFQSYNVSLAM